MTLNKFRKDFLAFLESSTVNLGRKATKTRQAFMDTAKAKFDAFVSDNAVKPEKKEPEPIRKSDSIICLKPKDKNKALDVGKGVHAMTPSESMRADEQLNRSPFGTNSSEGQ